MSQEAEILRSLGRLEGTVDAIKEDVTEVMGTTRSLDRRLGKVEARINRGTGIVVGIGALAGGGVAALWGAIKARMIG